MNKIYVSFTDLFSKLFLITIDEIVASIRRQYEELDREKQNFALEQTSREQTFHSELEQVAAEKE